mmetsp:Transcript_29362/g.62266  ORF Transcript_29362/g.62266 Transcript_29362/m.62266 type:complete len:251 (-) Transcript_29362:1181-1933(-)|eukprot:CAMPEP_0197500370 /NCGR_PEP_ID=MMETSP1311-20131121/61487_1 /TAXON_ID=464262 /ORGANISM="Genus nov. species nov., Strain RCC856" /LENGTH=250 /DNA_ID=CAMNT_0043046123 /DNA_START=641 /DNA_END=1393 /DNA_ORIENTATION=-
MSSSHLPNLDDASRAGVEEFDEASVWETDFSKEAEESATRAGAEGQSREGEEKENFEEHSGVGGKRRQSFSPDVAAMAAMTPEKEDSSKSSYTNLKSKGGGGFPTHAAASTPTTAYVPIKQSRIGREDSSFSHGGHGGGGAGFSQSLVQSDLSVLDQSLSVGLLGTSAPINIPDNRLYNQFYKKRGSGASNEVESPMSSTRAADFVPPHLIGSEEDHIEDPELSTSIMKREQLKHRNTILKQTGFLDSAK